MTGSDTQAGTGNYNSKGFGMTVRPIVNATHTVDTVNHIVANLQTSGCSWTIGESTALLSGSLTTSDPVSGLTYGFVVGTMSEVDTNTPSSANLIAATNLDIDGQFSVVCPYDGGNKFFRAYTYVNGQFSFGAIKAITAADLLDIEFLSDGSPINATFTNITGKKYGSPTVAYNSAYGRYEADLSMNEQSARVYNFYSYYYGNNSTVKSKIEDGFTLEVVCYVPAHSNNNSLWAIGSQESGGTGIGVVKNHFNTETYINGNYRIVEGSAEAMSDHYYHLVTTWDKTTGKLRLYVDGKEIGSGLATSGDFRHPQSDCFYYCIGGHPTSAGTDRVDGGWNGKVTFARLYDDPLSAEQVKALYDGLSK
jgi:hypothetical protein